MSRTMVISLTVFSASLYLAFLALCLYGWIMNVVAIAGSTDGVFTVMEVIRCIGVLVFPLGIVLGFV